MSNQDNDEWIHAIIWWASATLFGAFISWLWVSTR